MNTDRNSNDEAIRQAARAALAAAARGHYQRALAAGRRAWSGADLQGKASDFGGHYMRSRAALLARASAASGLEISTALVLSESRRWTRVAVVQVDGREIVL